MQKEFPIADDAQRKLEDDARRYNQLVTHPRDAHHLFALLLAHQRTSVGGVQFLNGILDQLHIQDMVKAAQLDTNRSWQAGAADGRTGTEIAADKMIAANMQIIDAQRAARAAGKGLVYVGGEPAPRTMRAGLKPEDIAVSVGGQKCEPFDGPAESGTCPECEGVGGFVEEGNGYQTEQTGVRCEACKGSGCA